MKRPLIAAVLIAFAALPAAAQDKKGLVWDNRPSIVFGEDLNIDVRGRRQCGERDQDRRD